MRNTKYGLPSGPASRKQGCKDQHRIQCPALLAPGSHARLPLSLSTQLAGVKLERSRARGQLGRVSLEACCLFPGRAFALGGAGLSLSPLNSKGNSSRKCFTPGSSGLSVGRLCTGPCCPLQLCSGGLLRGALLSCMRVNLEGYEEEGLVEPSVGLLLRVVLVMTGCSTRIDQWLLVVPPSGH